MISKAYLSILNLLQETIVQLVKSGGEADGNLFMVGDVKQSIYRFRLAEPLLFLGKYSRFTNGYDDAQGVKIDLNANFRSRKEVLDATNYIFSQIMGERVGEIDYDDAAALKYGAKYPEKTVSAELALLYEHQDDDEADTPEEDLKNSQAEARYMIRKIQQLMASGVEVTDAFSDSKRPIEYKDIVILMRSMTWSGEIAEEFKLAGIPIYTELSRGYFDAMEVMIMLNTLRVIDNPYQDIPLVSVLRAPFVGLTENELAQIRLVEKNSPFYDALKKFIAIGGAGISSEAQHKIQKFMVQFEEWRNLARRGSLSELIWQVYADTHYYEMVGVMPNGNQRQANLRALHSRAIDYEKTSFRGLFRFLRFIDRMKKRGDDLGTARALSETENVVRMMTIHSSKGLEFPYVFVAGIGRKFNKMDFNEPYLFDQHFGLAVKAIDPDNRIMYTSLPFLAMKEKKELEMRAEEMRVLYVAMTRAKEHLEMIASVKDIEKMMTKWQDAQMLAPTDMLPEYTRSRANSYVDWVGPAVARHADYEKFGMIQDGETISHPSKWTINAQPISAFMIETDNGDEESESMQETVEPEAIDPRLIDEVKARFDFVYPHLASVAKRSKQSVSELKRLSILEKASSEDAVVQSVGDVSQAYLHERPSFMQKRSLSSAEIGTAMHTIMQHIDLRKDHTVERIERLVTELLERQLLTLEEANVVNTQAIAHFFQSSLAQRLMKASRIRRELPFTYALDGKDGDFQILQGIIDCLFEEKDGWVLLDYKTDQLEGRFHSTDAVDAEMHKRYSIQLNLYKKAIENITGIHIKEMMLYLFDGERTVHIQEDKS